MDVRTKAKIKKGFGRTGFILKRVILVLIIVAVAGVATMFVYHTIQKKSEIEVLSSNSQYNIIEAEGCSINLNTRGSSTNHTIVTISDIESDNFSVYANNMAKKVLDKCRVVTIDRPGYGFSKDTTKERSAQNIVKEYRKALQKADIDPPYILMSVGFGSVYATTWQSLFPDEIEGMVFISPVEISDKPYDGESKLLRTKHEDFKIKAAETYETLKCKLGFQRLTYSKSAKITSWFISVSDAEMIKSLEINGKNSFAKTNELRMAASNYKLASGLVKKSDIPKMCIVSEYGFENDKEVANYLSYVEMSSPKDESKKETVVSSTAANLIAKSKKHIDEYVKPFAEKVGNCHIVYMGGDKYVYEQRMQDASSAVNGYINFLDGKSKKIYSKYFDTTDVKWQTNNGVSGYKIINEDKNTASLEKDSASKAASKEATTKKSNAQQNVLKKANNNKKS